MEFLNISLGVLRFQILWKRTNFWKCCTFKTHRTEKIDRKIPCEIRENADLKNHDRLFLKLTKFSLSNFKRQLNEDFKVVPGALAHIKATKQPPAQAELGRRATTAPSTTGRVTAFTGRPTAFGLGIQNKGEEENVFLCLHSRQLVFLLFQLYNVWRWDPYLCLRKLKKNCLNNKKLHFFIIIFLKLISAALTPTTKRPSVAFGTTLRAARTPAMPKTTGRVSSAGMGLGFLTRPTGRPSLMSNAFGRNDPTPDNRTTGVGNFLLYFLQNHSNKLNQTYEVKMITYLLFSGDQKYRKIVDMKEKKRLLKSIQKSFEK